MTFIGRYNLTTVKDCYLMLHRSTWEPESHTTGTSLLPTWKNKKLNMDEEGFQQLNDRNRDEWEKSHALAAKAKDRRQEKRVKKRKKLSQAKKMTKQVEQIDSDSHDDMPIIPRIKSGHGKERAPAVQPQNQSNRSASSTIASRGKITARRSPIELSSSDSEDSSAHTSEDSLLAEIKEKAGRRAPKQARKPQDVESDRPAQRASTKGPNNRDLDKGSVTASIKEVPEHKHPNAHPVPVGDPPKSIPDSHGLRKHGDESLVASKSTTQRTSHTTSAALPSAASSAAPAPVQSISTTSELTTSMKRTTTGGKGAAPIRIVNQPKVPLRKQWNTIDKQYNKIRYRALAEKRSRMEGTPDPAALEYVNGVPEGLTPRSLDARPQENIYGRRETELRRNQDRYQGTTKTNFPLQPYEIGKVPLVCFDWRSGSCPYTPERCRFLHRTDDPAGQPYKISPWNGAVPPKYADPPQTCFYWLRGENGCDKSADDCFYAHENTGWLARAGHPPEQISCDEFPGTGAYSLKSTHTVTCFYWFTNPNGCFKSAEQCNFAHENTGLLANTDGRPNQVIDYNALPAFIRKQQQYPGPRPKKIHSSALTCFFWNEGMCNKVAEECSYQHRYTGVLADPPKNWVPRKGWQPSGVLRHQEQISPLNNDAAPSSFPDNSFNDEPNLRLEIADDYAIAVSSFLHSEATPSRTSCIDMKKKIEDACKLSFKEIFTYNQDQESDAVVDRRAFVLFHPEHHMEELELITRWLLMHHVEVFNFWSDTGWEYFKEWIVKGGSGVIIAHPEFEHWADIPDFGEILRGKVRLWSIGLQEGYEYDRQMSTSPPIIRYDRIEIFPHGGIIYITDDVFMKKPEEALKIFELFIAKIESCRHVAGPIDPGKRVDDGCLLWRLAVRPELMQALYDKFEAHEAEIEAGDPFYVSLLQLYELLSKTKYIEQEEPRIPIHRPDDYFPIISERYTSMEEFYYPALTTSQSLANTRMIEYFGGMLIDLRQYYRQYFVVHTEPNGSDAKDWKERIQNIDEVMSPEKIVKEFEAEAKGNRFEFYEWAFPMKPRVDSAAS
jgi:chromo domain-containing protein 1